MAEPTAYVIKAGNKPAGDHFGGEAPVAPPACATCGTPMKLLAVLTAHPVRLPLGDKQGLAIFQCESGTRCAPWKPGGGANAVVLLEQAPAATGKGLRFEAKPDVPPGGGSRRRERLGSKVGGFPTWVRDDETPTCSACGGPMSFALQLDEACGGNLGDDGIGYVFLCPHGGKFLSQSG